MSGLDEEVFLALLQVGELLHVHLSMFSVRIPVSLLDIVK